jgi:hypothetical protein
MTKLTSALTATLAAGIARAATIGGQARLLTKSATSPRRKPRMINETRFWGSFVTVLLLAALAGCGGDDEKKTQPVAGTFVGTATGAKAFVSVVAAPAREGEDRREVIVYVCDGRRVCEWFAGSATGDDFTVKSDGGGQAKGELSDAAATGTAELSGGETVRYKASPAAATAGLYELTVSSKGRIRGASAAGVGLTGNATLSSPGSGSLKLADGTRVKFVTRDSAAGSTGLRAGEIRLIVLSGGKVRGAGRSRGTGGEDSTFYLRSSSG